jgi:hypothetical protein
MKEYDKPQQPKKKNRLGFRVECLKPLSHLSLIDYQLAEFVSKLEPEILRESFCGRQGNLKKSCSNSGRAEKEGAI